MAIEFTIIESDKVARIDNRKLAQTQWRILTVTIVHRGMLHRDGVVHLVSIRVRSRTHGQNIRLSQYFLRICMGIGVDVAVDRCDLYISNIAIIDTACLRGTQIRANPFIDRDDIASLNHRTAGIIEGSAARIRRA
ncbi:hypothetical protein D3C84_873100 [compost metagenome]